MNQSVRKAENVENELTLSANVFLKQYQVQMATHFSSKLSMQYAFKRTKKGKCQENALD